MSTRENIRLIARAPFSIEANRVDPDQTAPIGAV